MTVIRPNSIAGITSLTALGGSIDFYNASGAGIQFNNVNLNNTSGVSTFSNINAFGIAKLSSTTLIGGGTSTGTASQTLQVTGGAYFSGSVGIGTTNPTVELQLSPNASISNVGSGITLPGTVGSALTVAQFYHKNFNSSYLRIKATRNETGSNWTTASTKLVQVIDVTEQGYVEFNPNGATYGMAFGQGGTEWVRFLQGGNLGIGTTNPSEKLHVIGNILASGNVSGYSDIRFKDNIQTISNALDKLSKLRGVEFDRNDIEEKPHQIGVIAQEVEEIIPEVVNTDNKGIKSVAYGNLVGLLIEAIKDLKEEVNELKAKLEEK